MPRTSASHQSPVSAHTASATGSTDCDTGHTSIAIGPTGCASDHISNDTGHTSGATDVIMEGNEKYSIAAPGVETEWCHQKGEQAPTSAARISSMAGSFLNPAKMKKKKKKKSMAIQHGVLKHMPPPQRCRVPVLKHMPPPPNATGSSYAYSQATKNMMQVRMSQAY